MRTYSFDVDVDIDAPLTLTIPATGTPQGGVISPLLANIYLDALDQQMANAGWVMVRYADDFVILCHNVDEATCALADVHSWTAQAGLTVPRAKPGSSIWANPSHGSISSATGSNGTTATAHFASCA